MDAELGRGARQGTRGEVRGRQPRHQDQDGDHRLGRPADPDPDGAALGLAARPDRGAARLGRALRAARASSCRSTTCSRTRTTTSRPPSTTSPGTASCGASPTASRRTASSTTRATFKAAGLDPAEAAGDLDRARRRRQEADRQERRRQGPVRLRHHRRRRVRQHRLPLAALHLDERRLDHLRRHEEGDRQRAGGGRGGEILHRLPHEGVAALDPAERRHRQPAAVHRRDGRHVPVRPVRHRARSARRTRTSTSAS